MTLKLTLNETNNYNVLHWRKYYFYSSKYPIIPSRFIMRMGKFTLLEVSFATSNLVEIPSLYLYAVMFGMFLRFVYPKFKHGQ